MKFDLAFFSLLSNHETRKSAATQWAKSVGAEELLFFDLDLEVDRYLPSPCFSPTLPDGARWQILHQSCPNDRFMTAELPHPETKEFSQVNAYKYNNQVILCFISPSKEIVITEDQKLLLQNFARLLKSERVAKRYKAQNATLSELTTDLKAYSDILTRTRADLNDALMEARAQKGDLHDFFTQAPAPMTILMGAEHKIYLVNEAFEMLVGRSVVGKKIAETFSSEAYQAYIEILDRVYESGDPFVGRELEFPRIDSASQDEILRVNVSFTPFRAADGSIKGVLVFLEDVTDQFNARLRVEQLAVEAQIANQAKSQFLANMSHEIRTPMNAILGFADLLWDQDLGREEHIEYLKRIRANGDHLLALVDDVLDLSRVEAGHMSLEMTEFSIVDMVKELFGSFSLFARGKAVRTELELGPVVPSVIRSDVTRVRQVITNLLSNAVKFTDAGGVRLSLHYEKLPEPTVVIEVTDTGIGIPKEVKENLFEPFSQGDSSVTRRFGGTGLGLALSRRIAEALDGELALSSSELGKGSTFQFRLPVKGEVQLDEAVSINSEENPSKSSIDHTGVLKELRILCAEDSPDNRAVIRAFLRKTQASIIFAENGAEAIEKAFAEEVDLILMDIQMPILDGLSATQKLRELGFEKTILALTAHALPEEIERSHLAGCNGHLTKPIGRDALIAAILEYAKV